MLIPHFKRCTPIASFNKLVCMLSLYVRISQQLLVRKNFFHIFRNIVISRLGGEKHLSFSNDSELKRKIRDCARQRGSVIHARNHALFIAIAQEVVRWSYKALHSRERKKGTWISRREELLLREKKKRKKYPQQVQPRTRAQWSWAARVHFQPPENLRVPSIISQRLILFMWASPSGTALSFIRKREWGPVLLNNYYIPGQACPACIAFTLRTSSHSWARSVVRVMIDRY